MKKLACAFMALITCIAGYADTIPGGYLSGVWTLAGSPYLINGTTEVPDGNTLTIEAGVTVKWLGSYTMHIQGQILANGTATDSILFTAADPATGFRSIRFLETNPVNDTSRFEYCTFEYGNVYGEFPDNCGGALFVRDFSKLVIDHCTFRNNLAVDFSFFPYTSSGGAICLWTSSAVIKNSKFEDNIAYSGGAVVCYLESHPIIEGNTFTRNHAIHADTGEGYGGAFYCIVGSNPVISHNIFTENTAENGGGGFACISNCIPIIHHNLFYNDTASWGGAIEIQDTCTPQIINNTIAHNYAHFRGGGIDVWTQCYPEIWNTILWDNTALYGPEVYMAESNDFSDFYYCDVMNGEDGIEGYGSIGTWKGMIDEDPLFEGSDTCYYQLMTDSPCIDEGDPDCTDPDGTVCDMGAFWCNYLGVGLPPIKIQNSGLEVDIYPNPAEDQVVISVGNWHLAIGQNVKLTMVDLFGREVQTLVNEEKSPGEYMVRMDVSDLPAGVYLVRLQAGEQVETVKVVVMR